MDLQCIAFVICQHLFIWYFKQIWHVLSGDLSERRKKTLNSDILLFWTRNGPPNGGCHTMTYVHTSTALTAHNVGHGYQNTSKLLSFAPFNHYTWPYFESNSIWRPAAIYMSLYHLMHRLNTKSSCQIKHWMQHWNCGVRRVYMWVFVWFFPANNLSKYKS